MNHPPLAGRLLALALAVFLLHFGPASALQAESDVLEIRPGDRIALVGGTFIERDQQYGYLELALHLALPETPFQVRNLGWSGDTVTGIARARFGNQQEGYSHLMKALDLVQPTIIVVGYGTNEAFDGEMGLKKFEADYAKLLNDLQQRTERIVLITPPAMENLGPPLPDPAKYNSDLQSYREAIQKLAYDRGHQVLDLTELTQKLFQVASKDRPAQLTDNGQHFTREGYRVLAKQVVEKLGLEVPSAYPASSPAKSDPTEEIRQTILRKNQLFFDRYRPQNETYLYLFRKHEQGNNAAEIPQFDPLVEAQDQRINELKQSLAR